jgi:hypothetical protein
VGEKASATKSTPQPDAMTFLECVDLDLKEAMRARETAKVGGLRMLKSALKYA